MKKRFKTILTLLLVSLFFTNCSNETIDTETEVLTIDDQINVEEISLTYHYKGEIFNKGELTQSYGSEIFETTHWLMEDNENAFLFDDTQARENYLSNKYSSSFARPGYIVFHSGDWGRGYNLWRPIDLYDYQNLFGFWKNRARSVSTRNINTISIAFLYDKQSFKGQQYRIFIPPSPNPTNLKGFVKRAESFRFL